MKFSSFDYYLAILASLREQESNTQLGLGDE